MGRSECQKTRTMAVSSFPAVRRGSLRGWLQSWALYALPRRVQACAAAHTFRTPSTLAAFRFSQLRFSKVAPHLSHPFTLSRSSENYWPEPRGQRAKGWSEFLAFCPPGRGWPAQQG